MSIQLASSENTLSNEVVEGVLVNGDLSKLNVKQRLQYYLARCNAAGLDPITRPFEFISLNGKLVLYAPKACTDQLAGKHGLSHEILSRGMVGDTGLYEAVVKVSWPDGRSTADVGVVIVKGLTGEALANAMMKAVTKAKRRAVLSACGLGDVIDETELDTCEDVRGVTQSGQAIPADNQSGHGSGKYASAEQAAEYVSKMEAYLEERNSRWLDRWSGKTVSSLKELANIWQLDNHLVKWAMQTGRLDANSAPESGVKNRQIGLLTGVVFGRGKGDRNALGLEAKAYLDQQEQRALEKLAKDQPELIEAVDSEAVCDPALASDEFEEGGD